MWSQLSIVAVKIFFGVAAPIGRSADVGRAAPRPGHDRQALQPGVRQGDCRQAVQHVVRGVHAPNHVRRVVSRPPRRPAMSRLRGSPECPRTFAAQRAVQRVAWEKWQSKSSTRSNDDPHRRPGDARDKLQYAMGVRARAVAAAGSASSTYELEVAYGVGDCVALMHTLRGSLECLGLE